MKRLAVVVAVLGFAAPALANEQVPVQPAVMSDAELDQVAGGCDSQGNPIATNVNVSPIIVNQTAIALTTQQAGFSSDAKGKGKHGKGKAKGRAYGQVKQSATTVALNTVHINYNVSY